MYVHFVNFDYVDYIILSFSETVPERGTLFLHGNNTAGRAHIRTAPSEEAYRDMHVKLSVQWSKAFVDQSACAGSSVQLWEVDTGALGCLQTPDSLALALYYLQCDFKNEGHTYTHTHTHTHTRTHTHNREPWRWHHWTAHTRATKETTYLKNWGPRGQGLFCNRGLRGLGNAA